MRPRHLFRAWKNVETRLYDASRLLLILDFDGTLAPLSNNRESVRLDPPTRRVLRRLVEYPGLSLYIMSGRRLDDLRKRASIAGVQLLGLHGWEKRGAALPLAQKKLLRRAKRWLADSLEGLSGISIEDKTYVLAVHYRGAPIASEKAAKRLVLAVHREFQQKLRMLEGKMVWELLPAAIAGKGPATLGLLTRLPDHTLPIFVGDDTSDESAFAVLQHGLAVRVGKETRTRAPYFLHDPNEVREFLERLDGIISSRK